MTAGWLVNATGPGTDLTTTPDPLLRSLLASGLIRPAPHRLGIDADTTGAVLDATGMPSPDIFTIGPTLRGLRYETTAIPEICDQAAALATRLTTTPQRTCAGTAQRGPVAADSFVEGGQAAFEQVFRLGRRRW
jgi:uncharacterized NAD(P)/FAD-binding protein YdhS